jgi:hypothetical protein
VLTGKLLEQGLAQAARVFKVELPRSGDHDIIIVTSEAVFQMAKALANRPLYAVTLHRIAFCFDGNAETEMSEVIRNTKNRALTKAQDLRAPKKLTEFPVVVQPIFGAEREIT